MRLGILLIYEVDIVGADQTDIVLARELHQSLVHLALHLVRLVVSSLNGRLMQLQLEVVILAKEVFVPQYRLLGLLQTLLGNKFRYLATQASRAADKTFVILFELVAVCSRAVIETLCPRLRYDFEQVFVALEILCKENKVVAASIRLFTL